MKQPEYSQTPPIDQWASRQLADYDARTPGSLFADGVVLDAALAYRLQAAVAGLRCERGERIIGYKVGCTSPTIRKQLGIDQCITGRLFDSERHATGATLSRANYARLAIEGELAVELSREPMDDDFVGNALPPCVGRVFPVIELHHHVIRGERPSAGELIANNAIHAGFVEGRGVHRENCCGDPSLSIFTDGRLLETCQGPALVRTIASSLKWLMQIVQERGDSLRAGQIVLTGSIPSLIPIDEDCRVRVDAPPFGDVEAKFIA